MFFVRRFLMWNTEKRCVENQTWKKKDDRCGNTLSVCNCKGAFGVDAQKHKSKAVKGKESRRRRSEIGAELGIEVVYWRLRARTLKEKKRRLSITESATKRRHRFDTALQHCSSPLLTPTTGSATRSHMWSKREARVLHLWCYKYTIRRIHHSMSLSSGTLKKKKKHHCALWRSSWLINVNLSI